MRCSLVLLFLSSFFLSCAADDHGALDTSSSSDLSLEPVQTTFLLVLDTFQFVPVEEGIAPGFNIDGVVSGDDDAGSCNKEDLIAPDGEEGIDNQLAKVVPLFDFFGVGAALNYVQDSIEEGGVLIMFEIAGVDDFVNDPIVSLEVKAGFGIPLLGTDGRLLANQTFHLHPDSPDSFVDDARIEDGVLHAGPFNVTIPFAVLGMDYQLTFNAAQIEARCTEEGWLEGGVLGGGGRLEDLYAIGETAAADDGSVLPAIKQLFDGMADLQPDEEGECQQVSCAVAFSAVPAFFFASDLAP